MTFKHIMKKVRRALLCCKDEEKNHSLEISGPTDVRRGVLDMPGLTEEQRDFIREKASTDAARLLSLTSHPPTRPSSGPPSPPESVASSRSPSTTLLNSASTNLPSTLPTPPRQKHNDTAPPSSAHSRMKGFWERTRRLSNTLSTNSHTGYEDLKDNDSDKDEGVVLLNMDFKDIEPASPASTKSIQEGFEVQDILVGGKPKARNVTSNEVITKAIQDTDVVSSSGSSSNGDEESRSKTGSTDRVPLVNA